MKTFLAAVSVLGLAGAAGFVAWSSLSRPVDECLTADAAQAFNLQSGPAPARPAPRPEVLRDSVSAAPVSPRPIPAEGLALAAKPAPRAAVTAARILPPKAAAKALKSRLLAAMLAKPAAFLTSRTALRGSRDLRGFLADKRRVDAYMNSGLVRAALNSPAVAKAVLGNGRLVRAFLGSPALQDPAAIRDLARSPMLRKMLDCPGVQQALADPAVVARLASDPETARFMAENPQALQAVAGAVPALAGAFSR